MQHSVLREGMFNPLLGVKLFSLLLLENITIAKFHLEENTIVTPR